MNSENSEARNQSVSGPAILLTGTRAPSPASSNELTQVETINSDILVFREAGEGARGPKNRLELMTPTAWHSGKRARRPRSWC
jgi:hypothetical protein